MSTIWQSFKSTNGNTNETYFSNIKENEEKKENKGNAKSKKIKLSNLPRTRVTELLQKIYFTRTNLCSCKI